MTTFDFAFFTNGKIMALDSAALQSPLAADQVIPLRPRRKD